MKLGKDMSNIEIKALVSELKKYEESYIEKINFDKRIQLRLHNSKKGKIMLYYEHPYLFLTKKVKEIANKGFGQLLKKYINNAKIIKIKQLGSDRTICLYLHNDMKLIFELFFKGNIMLLDEKNKIIGMSNKKGGSKKETDVFDLNKNNFYEWELNNFKEYMENKEIVKALARLIGNVYAEEICYRLNIDKKSTSYDIIKVWNEVKKMINSENTFLMYNEYDTYSIKKLTMFEKNEKIDKEFIKTSERTKRTGSHIKQYASFSELIEVASTKIVEDEQIKKLKKAIALQNEQINEQLTKIANLEKALEFIYSNYQLTEDLLKTIEKNEEKNTKELIFKINNTLNLVKIKSLDKKKKNIVLEIKKNNEKNNENISTY